jgi:hypothetical protein
VEGRRKGLTRQKFSFALRLDVSTPSSPSLRLSREVIVDENRDEQAEQTR